MFRQINGFCICFVIFCACVGVVHPARARTPPAAPPMPGQVPEKVPVGLTGVTVPLFALDAHGGPVIAVRLNNKTDGLFLISTSNSSCITGQTADALGLTRKKTDKGDDYVTIDSFKIDALSFDGPLLIADLPSLTVNGKPINGIIGANIISRFAVQLDFDYNRCMLLSHGNLDAAALKFLRFNPEPSAFLTDGHGKPLAPQTDTGEWYVSAHFQSGRKESAGYPLLLSTSIYHSLFPYLSRAAITGEKVVEKEMQTFTNRQQTFDVYRVEAVQAGMAPPVKNFTVGISGIDRESVQPMLGMDILSRYRVLVDYPARKLYLEPVWSKEPFPTEAACKNAAQNIHGDTYGFTMEPNAGGEWHILSGKSDADLAKAGVLPGDRVEAVNGQNVTGLLPDQVAAEFAKNPTARLHLRRGVKTMDVLLEAAKITPLTGK